MFLNDFILRKIASQLQPWLIQEPEWNINLGLCHSHIVARNLRFDISALNHLIGGGLRLSFSTVEVAEVNIRIAHWSGPAFTVEVHGVDVTMTTKAQEEEGSSEPPGVPSSLQLQKKILAKLDPEGSALHERLETLMASAVPKNWVQISATNLGLSHLCLLIYDMRLRVKFSFSDEQVQLLTNISEVNVNCLDKGHGCLLKGFISSMFRPLREGYVKINARGLEILIERKDKVNNIISFIEPSISITMKDSRLVNFTSFASELRAFFTASELQMILAINSVVTAGTKHHRTGRQLWGIARTNISSSLLSTKYSLYKVFTVAVLFLRLVKAYELILVLVNYLADKSLGQILMNMSRASISSQSIQQQWELISDIEKELPVEAISWARQVARHRAALKADLNEDIVDSCAASCFNYFRKILLLLAVAWSAICKIFKIIFIIFYPKKLTTIVSEDFVLQRSFSFNVGKVSTVVSPADVVQGSAHQRQNLRKRIAYLDLLALCILIEGVFLLYEEDIFEENLTFSLGSLQVASSSSMKRQWKERVDNLGTVMWVEPAILFSNADENGNGSASYPRSSLVLLKTIVGDMWPVWKRLNSVFPGNNILAAGNPCLLVDIKNHWIHTDAKSSDAGSWKCSLLVGKLNLSFGYTVLLSLAVLFQQLQYVFNQLGSAGTARVFPHSPRTFQDSSGINWHGRFRSSSKGLKLVMLRLLPCKPFEFGALIAGVKIDILLRKEESLGSATDINLVAGQNGFNLTLDISKIHLVVWPTSVSGHPRSYDIGLEEAMMPAPSESNSVTYVCQGQTSISYYFSIDGVNAYFEDSEEDQHLQILVLKEITFKLSFVRDYLLSFGATSVALSVAFSGVMAGLFVSLNVDELSVMSQVIGGIFHAASPYVFGDSSSNNGIQNHPTMNQGVLRDMPEREEIMLHNWEAAALDLSNHSFLFTGTFEFDPSILVLQYSRKVDERESSSTRVDDYSIRNPTLLDTGVWLSLHKTNLDISCGEEKADIHSECSQFKAVLFRCRSQIGSTKVEVDKMVPHSHDCLYEVCLSGCSFGLFVGSPEDSSSSEVSSALNSVRSTNSIDQMMHDSLSTSGNERLNPSISPAASSHCLVANFTFNVIFVGSSLVKNVLSAHQQNKLVFSLSLGGDIQRIHMMIQDGYVIVEAPVLANFAHCLTSYLHCLRNLLSVEFSHETHMKIPESGDGVPIGDRHIVQPAQNVSGAGSLVKFEFLEALTLKLSRLSIVILALNESGKIQEIISMVDICLKLKMEDGKRKFIFDLSHLEIHSQIIDKNVEKKVQETQIAHFLSNASSVSSSHLVSGEDTYAAALSHGRVLPVHDDARCSSSPVFATESFTSGSESQIVQASHLNYILKGMSAFISAETTGKEDENALACSDQCWDGNGSVASFDLTISLSEIQIVMDAAKFLNEAIEKEASDSMKDELSSTYQESPDDIEAAIPDGAVVAIQDVHQHIYISVDRLENKYSVSGTVHYSLVGESALFRVKWLKQRRWNFRAASFSLMSLYAKSDSGQPLRLNYCSGSGFVDISSTGDSGGALWKMVSQKSESCEGDAKLQPYNYLSKNTFYLVNKKNECGVAFIDEVPEFVRKPGHPFKFKMVHMPSLTRSLELLDTHSVEADGSNSASLGKKILKKPIFLPCINLKIERVTLTIVHELPDHKDRFPLLQGCIYNTQVNAQILSCKIRVMSKFTAELYYFSAHKIVWKKLVHPFETCIYYCSRFHSENIGRRDQGAPVRLHLRLKEVNVSLTELGLDILLHVIGKLDLGGPFAVKSSSIMANCWKVENLSSVNIVCTFYDNQAARVGSKECSFFNLRHLMDQPSEAQYVLIKLHNWGTFSTPSIRLFLSESQTFAWRTRIKSSQDSITYPGPCVVFDISNNLEEGLSIVVSPLLRIHNLTELNMELRFQRLQQNTAESAFVLLQKGDTIDDCMAAFDTVNFSAGSKKALLSLNIGNFIFSLRPEIKRELNDSHSSYSVEWSDNLNGGKAIHLFGVIDKLSYRVRKAFSVESSKCSFSTASCLVKSGDTYVTKMHFLVQSIARDIPVAKPAADPESSNSPVELQEQKEVYLLPTLKVSNLLQSDISVLVTETETSATEASDMFGNKATLQCGSSVELYANPAIMYFTVTLTTYKSSCKPVNSGDWVKKLSKQKDGIQFLDIVLEFQDGKYFASLRLTRSDEGILEAVIFTHYTLKNSSDFPMLCFTSNQKHLSRDKAEKFGSTMSPDLGCVLPAKSIQSWFMKSNKLCIKLLDEEASHSILDLDALSGLAELSLVKDRGPGIKQIFKLGVSLRPLTSKMVVPSQAVSLVPRYVVSNESDQQIFVRQCFLEDDSEGIVSLTGKQKAALLFQVWDGKTSQISVFDKLLLKHRVADDSSIYVQFKPHETELGWSGPVCVASLGRFFIKFRRSIESPVYQSKSAKRADQNAMEFAAVHVVDEESSLVMQFFRPPDIDLPYRIENHLPDASISYYQKDAFEAETLGAGSTVNYVWDDLTRPHQLVVKVNGFPRLWEINLDKLRPWRPFYRVRQRRHGSDNLPLDITIGKQMKRKPGQSDGLDMGKVGYEVYAEGPTRVLRICGSQGSFGGNMNHHSHKSIQLRFSGFTIQLMGHCSQDSSKNEGPTDQPTYTPIIVGRFQNVSLDSIFFDQQNYNQLRVQSINVDHKWVGAPFAAMLRRHQLSEDIEDVLFVVFVLNLTRSNVKRVKYSSILLQPIDLNLDEETMMKIVPFWRTSLSQSTQSQKYYFDHFEIHPVKIIANFLPVDSYISYSTAQETLRSLLHSVIKIPAIKNRVVELNGVSVTHVLVTPRELLFKCAQHYSWYAMRAIYIAKGSTLLPPSFASVFDDLASSSLDAFFDPSSSLLNVQGLTLGTFKLLSKYVGGKGFSGTKRYFGDLGKTLRAAGSNILFVAVTEVSDSVLRGAESSGFDGMVTGFHQGILKLAMEPSVLGTALMEGGPDRKINLDQSPGVDEIYIEGYLQAMLDAMYKQEYLSVRVIDNQVILKNLPPNSSLINEIMDRVKEFLVSKALLKGDSSTTSRPIRRLRGEKEWRIVPTVKTLAEHLFVSFAIRILRRQAGNAMGKLKLKERWRGNREEGEASSNTGDDCKEGEKKLFVWKWGIGKFLFSAIVAYIDGRLCRGIPHPVVRRIVSGFLLSFLDKNDSE